jgi:hypothetical protein
MRGASARRIARWFGSCWPHKWLSALYCPIDFYLVEFKRNLEGAVEIEPLTMGLKRNVAESAYWGAHLASGRSLEGIPI